MRQIAPGWATCRSAHVVLCAADVINRRRSSYSLPKRSPKADVPSRARRVLDAHEARVEVMETIGEIMRKLLLSTLGLLGAFACNTATPEAGESLSARATAALRAIGERDNKALAQCQQAVDSCNARVPDAAGSGVCARVAERCEKLEDRLAELRGPAEGCLHAVDACERHAPEQAQCSREISLCDALDEDAAGDRDKTLECEARVQACLVRAETLPDAALVACENMAAACDRVAENRANAGRGDAGESSGDDSSESDGDEASDGGTADSSESDEDDEGGGNQGPRPDRPPVGRGHGRGADAGVETAD
jgi:hypothetical protein